MALNFKAKELTNYILCKRKLTYGQEYYFCG